MVYWYIYSIYIIEKERDLCKYISYISYIYITQKEKTQTPWSPALLAAFLKDGLISLLVFRRIVFILFQFNESHEPPKP